MRAIPDESTELESKVPGGAAKPAEREVYGETAQLERATPDVVTELESKVPGGAAKPAEREVPGETAELERATPDVVAELESKVPGGAAKPAEREVPGETAELERVELVASAGHCSASSCCEFSGMFQALVVGAGASTTSGNIPWHCLHATHSLLLSPSTLLCTLPFLCSRVN